MTDSPLVLEGRLADLTSWTPTACPIASALEIVGTRSAMLILREACYGTRRFDEFARRAGLSEPVAAGRLRELTDAGLFRRVPYRDPGQRTRYEYELTDMGNDLVPAVLALYQWGGKYLTESGRPPIEFTHRDCGAPVEVLVGCTAGHDVAIGDTVGRRRHSEVQSRVLPARRPRCDD